MKRASLNLFPKSRTHRRHRTSLGDMSRKDFEFLAKTLRKQGRTTCSESMANELADKLAAENPRFNRQRFIQAALGVHLGDMGSAVWTGVKWYAGLGAVYAGVWVISKSISAARGQQGAPAPVQIAEQAALDFVAWPYKLYGAIQGITQYGKASIPIIGALQGLDGLGSGMSGSNALQLPPPPPGLPPRPIGPYGFADAPAAAPDIMTACSGLGAKPIAVVVYNHPTNGLGHGVGKGGPGKREAAYGPRSFYGLGAAGTTLPYYSNIPHSSFRAY